MRTKFQRVSISMGFFFLFVKVFFIISFIFYIEKKKLLLTDIGKKCWGVENMLKSATTHTTRSNNRCFYPDQNVINA